MRTGDMILVSGGSGGIGAAICRELGRRGYVPIVGYAANAQNAKAIAADTGGHALALDLTSDTVIESAVHWLVASGRPTAAVVLAASPPPGLAPFGKISDDELALQWRVNAVGPQRLVAATVKKCFRARREGRVLALLSEAMGEASGHAMPSMGAYVIAKYALKGVLAAAAGEYGWLKTMTISPSFVETRMLECFDARFLDSLRASSPTGRFAEPADVARVVADTLERS